MSLEKKKIVLGITGGIAAFKAASIASQLRKRGAEVKCIMTDHATKLITPLTMREISGNPVAVSMFDDVPEFNVEHIALARWADVFVIAPATADIIGKIANGIADDMLSTTVMATTAPVLIAPAMNTNMYLNPITQDNMAKLKKFGYHFIAPDSGHLACGIDAAKTHIFIQSMVPELTELTFYYMNLVTVARVQRNPTVKSEIKMRNFEASIPVGFFCYPISQAADITAFRATHVPVGEDQLPMLEQCKEIVHKFNTVYGDTLTDPEIVLSSNKACLRLPGIDGKAKMSKSLGNCIYLSDEEDVVKKKIMSMFTDPNHLRVQDPGRVEGNPVFIYLDAFSRPEHFAEFLPEYQNLDELKAHYQRGGLGDVKVKKFLNNVMQAELGPIRERRKMWEQRTEDVFDILKAGTEVAREKAAATLHDVRSSMRINYFEDQDFLNQ